jgi:allantoate deiminase
MAQMRAHTPGERTDGGRSAGPARARTASSASMGDARAVLERCDVLARCSEEPGRLTRRFATPALAEARPLVEGWMREAGLETRHDALGNLIGRLPGSGKAGRAPRTSERTLGSGETERTPRKGERALVPGEAERPRGDAGARTLLLGSHLDTVRDAGRYDGALGVLVAIACVERLRDRGVELPFALEVVGFADEEGVRYGTAFLGSAALAGRFDEAWLRRPDADGVTLADAIRDWGGDPAGLAGARRPPDDLLGYLEVHIEQGPVLDDAGLPVGVVTGIAGQTRARLTFSGAAGHAGTTPMAARCDALTAAAQWIGAVESEALRRDGLVATVGEISAEPGAANVIPGRVVASLDVRHPDDRAREAALAELRERAGRVAAARGVEVAWEEIQATAAMPCSPALTEELAAAVADTGNPAPRLASGAGHDAAMMAAVAPVAMLFVRSPGGISHHPDESVRAEDVAVALDVTTRFVERLAR